MDGDNLRRLKDIVRASTCPDGCRCHKLGPEALRKARRTGLDSLLERLDAHPRNCEFSVSFGGSHYCGSAARMDIAKLPGE